MKIKNEAKQIREVIRRLNYYEKGLMAGKKIKRQGCNLCVIGHDWQYGRGCETCLASNSGYGCGAGSRARRSIASNFPDHYDKKEIRTWQTELRRRANANLKAAGSKWRIAWERED